MKISKRKKILFSIVQAICASILILVVLELICRTFDLNNQNDEESVAKYLANWERQWNKDFYVIKPNSVDGFNSDGLRDYEHKKDNPQNKYRVVCLGDSVTFGYKQPYSWSYPGILQDMMNNKKWNAEVFNMALPGWSPRQAGIAYRRIAKKYKPNQVILGICLNDVAEMQNNLARPHKLLSFAYKHSQFVQFLMRPSLIEIHNVEELFENANDKNIENGWNLLFDEIRRISQETTSDGAKFTLVIFPFRLQVQEDSPPPTPQEKIRAFSEKNGIQCFDLLPVFQKIGFSAFIDYDHLSDIGARAVAQALIDHAIVRPED